MSNWIKTSKDKKIKSILDDKIVIIAPVDTTTIIPLFCPCCKFPMKTSEDGISFRRNGICRSCDDRWTNKPGITWPRGPDKKSAQWNEYIKYRIELSKPVITFK